MHQETNCILCYCVCPISEKHGQGNIKNSTCLLVNDQLTAIFTVAQLLEIPRAFCQNLLSQSGNPSEWMTRCDRCNELVNKAYKTFKEVHHLQKKYVDLKLSIKTRVLNSRMLNSVNARNNVTKTTERIRKYVFQDLPPISSVQKLDPDVQPDNIVIKTEPDLVLKLENDVRNHEENDWASENYEDHHGISLSSDIFETSALEELSNRKDVGGGEESDSRGQEDEDSNDRDWEGDDNSENSGSENEESQDVAMENESGINTEGKTTCDDCGRTFRTPEILRNHIRSRHKRHSMYKCLKCKIGFASRGCLYKHYQRKHPKDKGDIKSFPSVKVKCDVCGNSYSENHINAHKKTHLKNYVKPERERKFECEECGLKCLRLVHLEAHMAARHKDVPFKCQICNISFTTRGAHYKHHQRKHPEDKEGLKNIPVIKSKCDVCGKSYSEYHIKEHKRTHEEGYDPAKERAHRKKYKCEECGLECEKASSLERHIACKHQKDLPFKCTECPTGFKEFVSMRKHFQRKHPHANIPVTAPRLPCEICGQLYSVEYLKTHMLLHPKQNEKKFKCDICEVAFNLEEDFEVHKRGLHFKELNLEPYECKECAKTFKSDKWLRCHNIKEHTTTGGTCCPFCDKDLYTLRDLKRHIEIVHETEKFPCDHCYRIFSNKARLESHVKFHHQNSYECDICKKAFQRMDLLKYHRRGTHYKELNLEPIQCEECGKILKSRKTLSKHTVEVHTKDFKEFCSICKMGFYNKTALSIHTRQIHEKERNFTCSYCGMAFFASNQLKIHTITKHTMEYAVKCEICGHGSPSEAIHKKHMKRHGTKSYACEICGDAFAMQYELHDHQRGRHHQELGLEPFQCTECDKICNSRSSLKLHFNREHTKTSKLQCSYCEKQFMTNQRLLNHVRKIHNGEKPYQCELCGDAFFTTQQKQKHFQIHNAP